MSNLDKPSTDGSKVPGRPNINSSRNELIVDDLPLEVNNLVSTDEGSIDSLETYNQTSEKIQIPTVHIPVSMQTQTAELNGARPRVREDKLSRGLSSRRKQITSNLIENNVGNNPPKRWGSSASRNPNMRRKRSIIKPKDQSETIGPWKLFSWLVTCCFPPFLLKACGMRTQPIQQAWREKIALVFIIILICAFMGFLTFVLQQILCDVSSQSRSAYKTLQSNQVSVNGEIYDVTNFFHPPAIINKINYPSGFPMTDPDIKAGTKDLSFLFQKLTRQNPGSCKGVLFFDKNATEEEDNQERYFPCTPIDPFSSAKVEGSRSNSLCHFGLYDVKKVKGFKKSGDMFYYWKDVANIANKLVVYGGNVIDLSRLSYLSGNINILDTLDNLANPDNGYLGKDVSYFLRNESPEVGQCLIDLFRVGMIDTDTVGCLISNVIQYISLIVIIGLVFSKFFMAVFFSWVVSWRLGSLKEKTYKDRLLKYDQMEHWVDHDSSKTGSDSSLPIDNTDEMNGSIYPLGQLSPNRSSQTFDRSTKNLLDYRPRPGFPYHRQPGFIQPEVDPDLGFALHYSIQLVTCYSEGLAGIRSTLDSLANCDYPNNRQLLFVVCDGIIVGADNDMPTPDICLSLMKDFIIPPESVRAHSYIAIAEGSKRHNMAKVYAGYYHQTIKQKDDKKVGRVPMVLVVKSGTPEEAELPKPGNRGKRDSQVLLMGFLQKALFDDRMTELEYELFNAIWNVAGVTADSYESVLMVDADTTIYPDSLTRMVASFSRDPKVMGLCGETKIANKSQSWVTMIQVFEYYISHHLAKAFESIFGGVTCLPGCFSMYRIKAPKGVDNDWVPILANPEILQQYSENVVTTLHQKNLLLLGEDRYLTTLMLRTFPKRKLIFVPQAVCKTVVPDTFSVLLSQRRRWINSTIHNLLELVITRDLCGTFCFSMQFVVFMELIGTVVLPAAIIFTIYLIVMACITTPPPIIPLIILALILGLPAILILMTTRKISYLFWMFIYILALPIWNFVLPVYAFWHFDDFSWGQTRMIAGGDKDGHGPSDGEFDPSYIVMKRWEEFDREKRRRTVAVLSQYGPSISVPSTIRNEPNRFGNSARNLNLKNRPTSQLSDLDQLGYMSPSALRRVSRVMASEDEIDTILDDSYPASTSNPSQELLSPFPWKSQASLGNPRTSAINPSRISLVNSANNLSRLSLANRDADRSNSYLGLPTPR